MALGGVRWAYDIAINGTQHIRLKLVPGLSHNSVWFGGYDKGWISDPVGRISRLKKLHLQFGHGNWQKIMELMKSAYKGVQMNEGLFRRIEEELRAISETCDVCIRYKKTPSKPVVGFPLAKAFNEVVAMDLGELEGRRFLVLLDLATHFCQAVWIKSKRPMDIVEGLMKRWISIFGPPDKLLSDNGLEFQNDEMKILGERFNIGLLSTAAWSPWSNGLCEKMVGLVKDSLRKLREEVDDADTCLWWTIAARNSLHMKGGFSPNQLVFGRNTGFPTVEDTQGPSGWERGGESKLLKENLIAMHSAREL
jgi:hypothetical protein